DAFERALALASQTTDVSTWQALRLNLASVLWADGKAASRRRARELVTAGRDALAADAPDRGSYDAWLATYR
ncbi:MAG: hypothetical protein SFX73_38245, partial [Kofleriaceae bacterium]|nr:hypothetical protein [Kofleriaceae bacterium]